MLLHREQKIQAREAAIATVIAEGDDMEVLMMQDQIEAELAKPIPAGKRNVTLFALGNQMRQAQVPDWETKVGDRATQVGLDQPEIEQLIRNINRYGS